MAWQGQTKGVKEVLKFHLIDRDDIPLVSEEIKHRHIRRFEKSCPKEITEECRMLLQDGGKHGDFL